MSSSDADASASAMASDSGPSGDLSASSVGNGPPSPTAGNTDYISTVNLKLPAYWPSDPEVWFIQVEAYFAARRITSQKTMYREVISSLEPQYVMEIRDLLITPPKTDPYTAVKNALIARTQKSEQTRLRELLHNEELGDQTPSKLLRRMQQLLGGKAIDASLFRELFVQRLPEAVRLILAVTPSSLSIDELARLADKVQESSSTVSVNAAPAQQADKLTAPAQPESDMQQLRSEMSKLTSAVHALTSVPRGRSRFRSRTRSYSPSRSPSRSRGGDDADDSLCWYHRRFGDKAVRCRSPCSYQSGNQSARQ